MHTGAQAPCPYIEILIPFIMYEKYFKEIVGLVANKVQPGADGVYEWAKAHAPELYNREHALYEDLNKLWDGDFAVFKACVWEWGRTNLQIFKRFVGDHQ